MSGRETGPNPAREESPRAHPPRNPDVRFERSDVDAAHLLRFGASLVLGTAVVVVLLWRLFYVFLAAEAARQAPPPVLMPDPRAMAPPPPYLQTDPVSDLAAYRAEEKALLGSYGWVDHEKDVVRIPIDEAMRLVAEHGLPSFPEAAPAAVPGAPPPPPPPASPAPTVRP